MEYKFKECDRNGSTGANVGEIMDLSFLKGRVIKEAGIMSDGRFGIEYEDGEKCKIVVFDFNKLGIWISGKSTVLKDSPLYKLQKKVYDFFLQDPDAMSLGGCDFPEWDNATINEKPLTRSFEFVTVDGKSMIEFTLSEIKMMPDFVRELFASPDTRKDVGHILRKLNDWCFFHFEPELFN